MAASALVDDRFGGLDLAAPGPDRGGVADRVHVDCAPRRGAGCHRRLGPFQWTPHQPRRAFLRFGRDPELAVIGIVWALAMDLLGGLMPALRAARVPVTEHYDAA